MKSKILKSDRKSLVDLSKKMTPQMRLEAFYRHSQSLAQIHQAGKIHRDKAPAKKLK